MSDPTSDPRRFAVYFAPPEDSGLWRTATAWLGRDPATGARLAPPALSEIDAGRHGEITKAPCFYGFHATLKAPFSLRPGTDAQDLISDLRRFAAAQAAFAAPGLRVGRLGRFLALLLDRPSPEMDALAAACVRELDGYRAPLGEVDIARRRKNGLTDRQEAHLRAWGYPYVMDEFRFHMSLTGAIGDETLLARAEAALVSVFAPHTGTPLAVAEVCLFGQEDRGMPFRLLERFPFAAPPAP